MKKRLLSLALVVSIMASLFVAVPTAVNAETEGIFEYSIENGEVTITDCDTSVSGEIEIPATIDGYKVTKIRDWALSGCRKITKIAIPESVTSIGKGAFSHCRGLTSIVIPKEVKSIGEGAFTSCEGLINITIPAGVMDVGKRAFQNCSSLVNINVEEGNSNYSAFEGVLFNKDKTIIEAYAPGKEDEYYEIPDSVTAIGDNAFSWCMNLKVVTIPTSVTSIGNHAFSTSNNLTSITIPEGVTSIGEWAFSGCSSLVNINVAESNSKYSSFEGVLFNKDKTTIIAYPAEKVDEYYEIPDSVTTIGDGAFHLCQNLINVIIPDSVTTIGEDAFYTSFSLTNITISEGVTSIGEWAFRNCINLTDINVEKNNYNYSSKDGVLFNKEKTELIQYPAGKTSECYEIPTGVKIVGSGAFDGSYYLTNVIIPEGVTTIEEEAFYACENMLSTTIPSSVTSISDYAFDYCDSLADVYYIGTEKEWNDVEILSGNDPFFNATIHFLGEEPEDPDEEIATGDANGNGEITVEDVILIRRFVVGGYGVTVLEFAADLNHDGEIDVEDIILLRRLITGGYGVGSMEIYEGGKFEIVVPDSWNNSDVGDKVNSEKVPFEYGIYEGSEILNHDEFDYVIWQ